MEILFLGTSASFPTKERNTQSTLVRHNGEYILIDCGEGTQRQLQIAGISPAKIDKILISHWHSDHVLGLPGLLQTLGLLEYSKSLEIYGPKGTGKFMKDLFKFFIPTSKVNIKVKEISKEGIFLETKEIIFSNFKLNHSVNCLGFTLKEKDKRKMNLPYLKKFGLTKDPLLGELQRGKNINYKGKKILVENATTLIPGRKISIVSDTAYSEKIISRVKNSDILVIESTFSSENKDKAIEKKHLTSEQAAVIAKKSNSKNLILTHISNRYKSDDIILKEAKKIFKNTLVAKDLMSI